MRDLLALLLATAILLALVAYANAEATPTPDHHVVRLKVWVRHHEPAATPPPRMFPAWVPLGDLLGRTPGP